MGHDPITQYGEPVDEPVGVAGPARYATAGDLFGAVTVVETVDVPLKNGMTVQIQPITRKANLELGKGDPDVATMEARLLAAGVAQPRLSVAAWRDWIGKAPTTLVGEISNEVRRVSGLGEGADKSRV